MSIAEYSEDEAQIFMRIIRDMPYHQVYKLIQEYNIEVPIELPTHQLPEFLYEELDPNMRRAIIADYRDAGKVLCYFFTLSKKTPSLQDLRRNPTLFLSLKSESEIFENTPYFRNVEAHEQTGTLRVRFNYYKGRTQLFDKETQTLKEYFNVYPGVVIFRPNKRLVEVRAKHRTVSRIAANRCAIALKIDPLYPLNLYGEEYIRRFLKWIYSLNNARFEFDVRQALSSLSMSARGRTDLRKLQEFRKYLREGKLRGGHATIITEENRKIRFRIFFRDCRVYFTSFSKEGDIEIVADALEKITEGYEFETPIKTIEEYFK